MYELIKAGACTYYINCPAKIGVYTEDQEKVWLIDSGSDKEAGRKVRQILDKEGWKLQGIINTHSNADHIGGNRYLQNQTGCRIYAGGIEGAFTRYPVLEPSFLYGGYPCRDLRHKFLMAQESQVCELGAEGFPKELEILPLASGISRSFLRKGRGMRSPFLYHPGRCLGRVSGVRGMPVL